VVERYRRSRTDTGAEREILYLEDIDFQFSDGETCVRLEADVNGRDVFLFQALYDPISDTSVDQNYIAFLIAARAFREWGANRVTGVLPYLAYARQDKPTKFKREPTTANLMADLSIEAGLDRLVTWDPHTDQIRGFYGGIPVDGLSSLALFAEAFERFERRDDVIAVAPDAGASKFVTYFGRTLGLNCAIASKYRPEPEEAVISEIIGDFEGKRIAIVLDDMISTGGTIEAVVTGLVEQKGIEEVYVGVSHNLCKDGARQRLSDLHAGYHLQEVVVTNSIPQTQAFQTLPFSSVRCLSDSLARVIGRIHYNRSVNGLFARPTCLGKE
jgi:ribose-phosphate pyrophosphokinase